MVAVARSAAMVQVHQALADKSTCENWGRRTYESLWTGLTLEPAKEEEGESQL